MTCAAQGLPKLPPPSAPTNACLRSRRRHGRRRRHIAARWLGQLCHASILPLLMAARAAGAATFAPYDALVDFMHAPPADVDAALAGQGGSPATAYFDRPIPPVIHQVWFGSAAHLLDEDVKDWQAYAEHFGYAYHLWTEDDDPVLRRILGPEAFALMDAYRRARVFMAASDIVRYAILDRLGGIYLDVDIPTPKNVDGQPLDLRALMPLEGLIVPLEGLVREVGNGAIYLQNCILMACAGHPVVQQLVAGMVPNHAKWRAALGSLDRGVWYMTGQHLLSRSLAGAFTVVPYEYLEQIGMPYWQSLEERARRSEIVKGRERQGLLMRVPSVHRPSLADALAEGDVLVGP